MGERKRDEVRPRRIRLPLPIKGEIGLGDVISRVTSAAGIKPCDSCRKRADKLNQRIVFEGRCKDCS